MFLLFQLGIDKEYLKRNSLQSYKCFFTGNQRLSREGACYEKRCNRLNFYEKMWSKSFHGLIIWME